MLKELHALLQFQQPLHIVDIGANPIDGDPPYKNLLNDGLCKVTGFEPQADELANLLAKKSAHENYLPYAIGDGSVQTLNICDYSGWTSTLRPSAASLDVFSVFKQNATVIGTTPIQTRKLDDVAEIGRLDFLKIDIQGGELSVFQHGKRTLAQTAVIQTEVSFMNLYENQPSFGDIDVELRAQGFIPHCFAALKNGMIAPFTLNNDPWKSLNQLLEGDVVYVRDFRHADALDNHQLRTMCLIAYACYGSFDLAYRCLAILEARNAVAADGAQRYVELLNKALSAKRA